MKKVIALLACAIGITPALVLSQITKTVSANPSNRTAPATINSNTPNQY